MKGKLILSCFIAVLMLGACQKELGEQNAIPFCALTSVVIKNKAGAITGRYSYEYDSITRRPTLLQFNNLINGTSKTIIPTYKNDTIFLAQNSYLTVDASNRIETLVDPNAAGGQNLSYYYTYNSQGQLDQRLIDDGINDALRTNFVYTNDTLATINQDFAGFPQSLSAAVSLFTAQKLTGFNQFSVLELFPELLLYMPALQLGKITSFPLSEVEVNVAIPTLPPDSFTNKYSSYSFTPEGWLSSFQSDVVVNGVTESTIKYEFEYKCF